MSKLTARLTDPARSGVYRASRPDAVEEALPGTRLSFARIALGGASTKEALLRAIARDLAFPKWFGENWDALEDCLSDLKGEGHVLLFTGAEALPGDERGILLEVLDSVASFHGAHRKPFFAVFVDPARALPLADLYTER